MKNAQFLVYKLCFSCYNGAMVKVNCEAKDKVKLSELVPFQGSLKKRKQQDIDSLAESLESEGMMMPFAVWKSPEGKSMLLDGHGRLEALVKMSLKDTEILSQDFPAIYVEAESEEAARKALLQIVSTYGKIDKNGLRLFSQPIPEYTAPVLLKAKPRLQKKRLPKNEGLARVVVLVPEDKEAAFRKVLEETPYVKVL